jgi:hypothetical protein
VKYLVDSLVNSWIDSLIDSLIELLIVSWIKSLADSWKDSLANSWIDSLIDSWNESLSWMAWPIESWFIVSVATTLNSNKLFGTSRIGAKPSGSHDGRDNSVTPSSVNDTAGDFQEQAIPLLPRGAKAHADLLPDPCSILALDWLVEAIPFLPPAAWSPAVFPLVLWVLRALDCGRVSLPFSPGPAWRRRWDGGAEGRRTEPGGKEEYWRGYVEKRCMMAALEATGMLAGLRLAIWGG